MSTQLSSARRKSRAPTWIRCSADRAALLFWCWPGRHPALLLIQGAAPAIKHFWPWLSHQCLLGPGGAGVYALVPIFGTLITATIALIIGVPSLWHRHVPH